MPVWIGKIQFKLDKKSSSSYSIFETRNFKIQVQINRGKVNKAEQKWSTAKKSQADTMYKNKQVKPSNWEI